MSFNYKNPITPLSTLGNISVQRQNVFGTNFSILSTGGYMEVYNINELYYTIPPSTTGLIEYSGNSIPIQLNKGTGSLFSFDVLTLNSDNISSGRRRLGMLVYVIDQDQVYQYQIPNFVSLWNSATGATGPGGNTVIFSDFGTTVKSNTPEGVAFISAWTSNVIEGVSGGTSTNSVWKKLVTGGGGVFTGGTVTGNTIFTSGLTANTFSASTYLGLPGDIFITGGTFDTNTDTLTLDRSSGSSITITGFTDYYTTAFTYNDNTFTLFDNSGNTFPVTVNDFTGLTINGSLSASTYLGLPIDVYVTGGTYSAGTTTFTNNTGGTFNVTGFTTPFTGNTSGDCITDLFVSNINSCSPLHIQPINLGDVYIGENGGVNVGIGTLSPTEKLFVSGNTYITGGSSSFLVGNPQPYLARNLTNDFIQLNNDGFGQSVFASPSAITLSVGPVVGNGLKVINTNNLVGNLLSYNFADYLFKSYYSGSTNYFEINHAGFNGDNKFGVNTIPTATIHAKGVDSSSSNFGLKVQDSGGTNNLVVRNDGKVGINTSNPNYQLEVLPKDLTGTTQVVIRNTSTSPNWSPVSLSVIDGSNYGVTMSNSTNGVDTTLNINSGAYSYLNHQVNGNTVAALVTAGNFLLWRLPDNFNFRRLATNGDWINFNSLNQRVSIFNENIGGVTIPSRLGLRGDTNTSSTYSLVIQNSGGTNTLVVRDDGNIGIGTSTPTAKLNIKYEDPFTVTKDLIHIQQNYNSYSVFKITDNGSSGGSQINSEWATWGFGMSADTSTGNRISIKGNTSTSGTASIISKNSSDVYTFIVRDDGKVGVGTVSPSETLDVNGKTKTINFQITSGATNGYVLISDASGNATWTPQSGITGNTDTYVTGFTYNNANTITLSQNNGQSSGVTINTVTGLTINGNLSVTGNTTMRAFSGTSGYISGSGQNILTIVGSGNSTTSPLFSVQGSNGELFSVSDSLTGSLFSVNDISGLPILEVFSDNTTLMGSYLSPSLNTTTKVSLTAGTNTIYSIPTSAYTGAFFDYTLISTGSTGARAGTIMSIWSGSTAQYTETSTNDIGTTTGVTFSVAVSGSNAVLSSSATTAGWTVKTIVRSI